MKSLQHKLHFLITSHSLLAPTAIFLDLIAFSTSDTPNYTIATDAFVFESRGGSEDSTTRDTSTEVNLNLRMNGTTGLEVNSESWGVGQEDGSVLY